MNISDFKKELTAKTEEFIQNWKEQNRDVFPLELPSMSDWMDHFISYLELSNHD